MRGSRRPEMEDAVNEIRTALAWIEELPYGSKVLHLIEGTEGTRSQPGWVGIREIINRIIGDIIERTGWSGGVIEGIEIPEVIDQHEALRMLEEGTQKLAQLAYDTGAAETRKRRIEATGSPRFHPHSTEGEINFMKNRVKEIRDGLGAAGFRV